MIKIGIDIQAVVTPKKSGLGIYTTHLVQALTGSEPRPGIFRATDYEFHLYGMSRPVKNTPDRLLWENVRLPVKAAMDRIDLLHVPAFAAPRIKVCPLVLTVHDLIGMLFPNQIGRMSRFYWGSWLPASAARADRIIADSESTKRDLLEHLKVPEEKISVVYPSGHEGFLPDYGKDLMPGLRERFSIRGRFFIFVGTIEPRKNLLKAIHAFSEFRKKNAGANDYQLVIVGARDFGRGAFLRDLLSRLDIAGHDLVFTDYISHEELNALYCASEALVFASLYEGFGIPVLEAMAAGTPVIASNLSSVPEVGGDAALYVNPSSEQEIAEAMSAIAGKDSVRRDLIEKGFARTGHFSWKKAASEILEIYKSVL